MLQYTPDGTEGVVGGKDSRRKRNRKISRARAKVGHAVSQLVALTFQETDLVQESGPGFCVRSNICPQEFRSRGGKLSGDTIARPTAREFNRQLGFQQIATESELGPSRQRNSRRSVGAGVATRVPATATCASRARNASRSSACVMCEGTRSQ